MKSIKKKAERFSQKTLFKTKQKRAIPLMRLWWLSIFLNLLALATALFGQKFLPPQIPLFYGLAEGEQQLASSLSLIFPAILSITILTLNTLLIHVLSDNFLKMALVLTSLAISIFALTTIIKILSLVGSF